MAFRFHWPEFDNDFYNSAKSQLEAALNKGNKPSVIVDYITVKELHMGSKVNTFKCNFDSVTNLFFFLYSSHLN